MVRQSQKILTCNMCGEKVTYQEKYVVGVQILCHACFIRKMSGCTT